jgi:hypothetical protein
MTKQAQQKMVDENFELKKEIHELRCRYGDLADLVSEVACDYEAKREMVFLGDLVRKYRQQQQQHAND